MALKCTVKVGSISNLSDARYAAGMGVDMLGFCFNPASPDYISIEKFKEIIGWVSVPTVVAEMSGLSYDEILKLATEERFELIETDIETTKRLPEQIDFKIVLKLEDTFDSSGVQIISEHSSKLAYISISESLLNRLSELPAQIPILLCSNVGARQLQTLLDMYPIQGLALKGGQESKVGFKDYEELADVLEMLQLEDN